MPEPAPPGAPRAARSAARRPVWSRLHRHPGAIGGAAAGSLIALAVLFGPLIHRVDPHFLDYRAKNQGMSAAHPLGTDNLGRDTLARLLAGGRLSLAVGVTAMALSLTAGTLAGILAGFFRRLDGPLMRLTDLFLALPVLPTVNHIVQRLKRFEKMYAEEGADVSAREKREAIDKLEGYMQSAEL